MSKYDLEKRTYLFAKDCLSLINGIKESLANVEIARQLIRSSGSVGANYIEANEAVSRKDFFYRIKICRKEAKETRYWILLLDLDEDLKKEANKLCRESVELTRIFSSIIYSGRGK